MPFYPIDWGRIEGRREDLVVLGPKDELQLLLRPCYLLLRALGLWFQPLHCLSALSSTRWARALAHSHTAWLLALALLHLTTLLPLLRFWDGSFRFLAHAAFIAQSSIPIPVLYVLQRAGALDSFYELWDGATCSVGFLRHSRSIRRAVHWTFGLLGTTAGLSIAYLLFHLIAPPLLERLEERELVNVSLRPFPLWRAWEVEELGYAILVNEIHGTLAGLGLTSLLLSHGLLVLAELRVTNEDLETEENLYQVSVLKHYLVIHLKLRKLLRHYSGMTRWWLCLRLCVDAVGVGACVGWALGEKGPRLLSPALLASLHLLHSALFLALAHLLSTEADRVLGAVEETIIMGPSLESDFHTVLGSYGVSLGRDPPGLYVGPFFRLNLTSYAKVLILALIIFIVIPHVYV